MLTEHVIFDRSYTEVHLGKISKVQVLMNKFFGNMRKFVYDFWQLIIEMPKEKLLGTFFLNFYLLEFKEAMNVIQSKVKAEGTEKINYRVKFSFGRNKRHAYSMSFRLYAIHSLYARDIDEFLVPEVSQLEKK